MKSTRFPGLFVLIVLLPAAIFAQTPAEKVQKMAELVMAAYNAKDYAQIEGQFNAQMKAAVPGKELAGFLDDCHRDYGKMLKLDAPRFAAPSVGVFLADFEKSKLDLLVALDGEGKIEGLSLEPPKTTREQKNA